MPKRSAADTSPQADVRERILETASSLFYELGARAVGVDLVVARAGVAKTSLYRYFRTKDDLVAAFLQREDEDFWAKWDSVAAQHPGAPLRELEAHCDWIGERLARPGYRGCPQLNIAAEFPDETHPARQVAITHKAELRARLESLIAEMGIRPASRVAGQVALLINGAFVSAQILQPDEASDLLKQAVMAILNAQAPAPPV
ncbi:MAG: TetR family transcriptional regulator [Hyphomonas sp.]|uniref:TetR/AcrR family transcriptional regulator n=1 Tax=Hyphomonas sp. TaxID=87 RepID=UPI001E0A4B16|nr:TetR/AcrR family transcriptional regulator [Hyphomonas sp.]MBA4227167.1 TetR family transcriptional regulator [Hyphomonas sp.]